MIPKKEDCEQHLAHRLQAASAWRHVQATRYPDDARNAKAAERLLALASDITIPDTVWSAIAPFYNESDTRWLSAVSEINRDVGFRRTPKDFASYVDALASRLAK